MANHFRARPLMVMAALIGLASATSYPAASVVTRSLIGWNVGVWLYLLAVAITMIRADHGRLRKAALAHAEGAATVSVMIIAATLASLAAIVLELAAAQATRATGVPHGLPHFALALVTVTGSWLLLPTLFTLNYATLYYSDDRGTGLRFPLESEAEFRPTYADFAYFSFTIAVALQTADVVITTARMRKMVLVQSILSFVFNTAILALLINIASTLLF